MTQFDNEKWKPVVGYEGLYEVSNFGRVKRLGRTFKNAAGRDFSVSEKIAHQLTTNKRGYLQVKLVNGKIKKQPFVHRLLMMAFYPITDASLQVNHIDGNKKNNHIENLEWCTASDNLKHSHRVLHRNRGNQSNKMKEILCKKVSQFSMSGEYLATYNSIKDAAIAINGNGSCICRCISGERKTANKFIWKLAS